MVKIKGAILDSCELTKGETCYRGHVILGDSNQQLLIYSSVRVGGKTDERAKPKLLWPNEFKKKAPYEKGVIDSSLSERWPKAILPDSTPIAKDVASLAFGLPIRTSPYHQAA